MSAHALGLLVALVPGCSAGDRSSDDVLDTGRADDVSLADEGADAAASRAAVPPTVDLEAEIRGYDGDLAVVSVFSRYEEDATRSGRLFMNAGVGPMVFDVGFRTNSPELDAWRLCVLVDGNTIPTRLVQWNGDPAESPIVDATSQSEFWTDVEGVALLSLVVDEAHVADAGLHDVRLLFSPIGLEASSRRAFPNVFEMAIESTTGLQAQAPLEIDRVEQLLAPADYQSRAGLGVVPSVDDRDVGAWIWQNPFSESSPVLATLLVGCESAGSYVVDAEPFPEQGGQQSSAPFVRFRPVGAGVEEVTLVVASDVVTGETLTRPARWWPSTVVWTLVLE